MFQSKRKAEYSLSDQATKRMRVSKATKRASETSEQTLHRQLISGTTHAQFAEGLHFSAFHILCEKAGPTIRLAYIVRMLTWWPTSNGTLRTTVAVYHSTAGSVFLAAVLCASVV